MRIFIFLMMMLVSTSTKSGNSKHIFVYEASLPEIGVKSWKKIPNLDTLANYILTQSKTDSQDINAMVQVMLNRFNRSDFESFGDMLYSNTSYGSTSVKSGGGRYWFSEKGEKYLPLVKKEISKVFSGISYEDMDSVYYFSNHECTYHTSNSAYQFVYQTKKHKYFKKSL